MKIKENETQFEGRLERFSFPKSESKHRNNLKTNKDNQRKPNKQKRKQMTNKEKQRNTKKNKENENNNKKEQKEETTTNQIKPQKILNHK